MAAKLFTIHGAPELTQEIQTRVLLGLKKSASTKGKIDLVLNSRSKNLGKLAFFRLHVLNREFTGKAIPAIRICVTYARYANHTFKKIKSQLGRGQ